MKTALVAIAALFTYVLVSAAGIVAGSLAIWLMYQFAAWMVR